MKKLKNFSRCNRWCYNGDYKIFLKIIPARSNGELTGLLELNRKIISVVTNGVTTGLLKLV